MNWQNDVTWKPTLFFTGRFFDPAALRLYRILLYYRKPRQSKRRDAIE